MKKPFYKRWWVIAIALFLAIGFVGLLTESDEDKEARAAAEVAKPKPAEAVAPKEISKPGVSEVTSKAPEENAKEDAEDAPAKPEIVPSVRDAEIRKAAEGFIEKYAGSEIVKIDVNENLGANDGSFLVLAYMNFSRPNSAEKTRNFIAKYSEDLAANLAEEADVSDVVVFWEAPRFAEGKNVAKYTYKKAEAGMILQDEFVALELK